MIRLIIQKDHFYKNNLKSILQNIVLLFFPVSMFSITFLVHENNFNRYEMVKANDKK